MSMNNDIYVSKLLQENCQIKIRPGGGGGGFLEKLIASGTWPGKSRSISLGLSQYWSICIYLS